MSGSTNAHARLSPSGSKRWSTCTASVFAVEEKKAEVLFQAVNSYRHLAPYIEELPIYEKTAKEIEVIQVVKKLFKTRFTPEDLLKLPERTQNLLMECSGSVAAREGTRAHDFAEKILNGELTIDSSHIPEEFRADIATYVDACNQLIEEYPDSEVFIEEKVPLFYDRESKGTVDFAIVTTDLIVVQDLKFGAGVLVEAKENTQLAIYALSFIEDLADLYDFEPDTAVELRIVQPRHHGADPIRKWETTVRDLTLFCEDLGKAAKRIFEANGVEDLEFAPSEDACRWCGLKAVCKARLDAATEDWPEPIANVIEMFPDLSDKAVAKEIKAKEPIERVSEVFGRTLTDEELVALYQSSGQISALLADIASYLSERALSGDPAPGTKLVMGREGNRTWVDEKAADTLLSGQKFSKDERFETKLISVATAEKLLKDKMAESPRLKNRFEALIYRSPAKTVMALSTDKREAVQPATEMFEDLTEEDLSDDLD